MHFVDIIYKIHWSYTATVYALAYCSCAVAYVIPLALSSLSNVRIKFNILI